MLYSPPHTGALFSAVAVEDSVLLRISHEQRMRMQYHNPQDAYTLLLTVFKQVETSPFTLALVSLPLPLPRP